MKKTFLVVSALVFFTLAPHVFAQGFVPLTNIPGLTSGATATPAGLAAFLNNLYKYLIGLAAVLAVIEIVWGGLEISTQDSVSKNQAGKERITQAILGLILVLSPVLVFSIINPSILNLSLNLPPIVPITTAPTTQTGTPCTSNCGTGTVQNGATSLASDSNSLFLCAGSNCTAATTACTNQNSSSNQAAGLNYIATVVCAQGGSAVDPNGATAMSGGVVTACKAGDSLAVNCDAKQDVMQ